MKSPRIYRVSTLIVSLAPLLLFTVVVNMAHASSDDDPKPTLRGRLGAFSGSLKSGFGRVGGHAKTVARVPGKVITAGSEAHARCVAFLGSTKSTVTNFVAHSPEPWDLGPTTAEEIQKIWENAPTLETAARDHLHLIFAARLAHVPKRIGFDSVAESATFKRTIGLLWDYQPTDYGDFLRDTIDPRIYQECLHAVEMFNLAQELGQDFNERFDMIRAYASSVVSIGSVVPFPSALPVRAFRVASGPLLDHQNGGALIGASWEVARLIPPPVRQRLRQALENFIQGQAVPDSVRGRLHRFVHSGEFERVSRLIETLQRAKLLEPAALGADQLIVRSSEIDSPESQKVRDDLRRKIKPAHEHFGRVRALIGPDGVRTLERVFAHDEYDDLEPSQDSAAAGDVRTKHFENLIYRHQWARLKTNEREGIERAYLSLKYAHLEKDEFIEKLSEAHDNSFFRVAMRSFMPEALTKRAARQFPR